MCEFSIGDIVKIKDYNSIPQEKKAQTASGDPALITPRKSLLCGKLVEIVDRLYSERFGGYVYRVKEPDADIPSRAEFTEDFLEAVDTTVRYVCEVEDGGNVIIANIYEERSGERERVARGHGHVFHEGALGFTQALSYALKRAYQRLQDESSGGGVLMALIRKSIPVALKERVAHGLDKRDIRHPV